MTTDSEGTEFNCHVGRAWRYHCPELAAHLTPSDDTISPLEYALAITTSPCDPPTIEPQGRETEHPAPSLSFAEREVRL